MDFSSFARRAFLVLGLAVLVALALVLRMDNGSADGFISMEEASKLELPHIRSSFSPKNQGDDVQARYEFELFRLRDPKTGRIPEGIRSKELAFVRDVPQADELAAKTGGLLAEKWTFRGPKNVGGRTRALAVDLDYNGTSNRRILAGGISGGIYLSEDDGATWSLTTSLADLASVTSLAQDPNNRDIWYFGTGEFLGNSAGGGLQQYYGQGLFKSVDGGRSWSRLQSTVEGKVHEFDSMWDYVWNVAVHPSGAVFAATYGGIVRSTDGGNSWKYMVGREQENDPHNSITDVTVGSDGTVYAALSRNGSGANSFGVFKSSNAGDEWQRISPAGFATDPYRIVLGTAPSNANILYVLVQTNQRGSDSGDHQLFRTGDGGATWTDLSGSLPDEEGVIGNGSFSTQGGYDQLVRVKPDDANTVFIGGTNLYRSTDGGVTFTRIGGYSSPINYAQFDNHHADQHALAFLPTNANVAISGHDGGVSRSTNILAQPHSWTSLNNGYVTTQFYAVAIDPQAGGLSVIGGMQDNGSWGTQSRDGSAEWFDLFGGDGAYAAITPGATAYYVSAQAGVVYRMKENAFASVTPAGAKKFIFINPFVLDPNDPRVMYLGEAGGVWRNSNLDEIPDGSEEPTSVNWTFLNSSAQRGTRTTTIAVAKTPANRVYFGTTDFEAKSALVRVDNAQTNGRGKRITPPVAADGIPPYPSSIAVNPNNGDEIVAVYSNYNVQSIWHSSNAGGSWTNIDGNLGGEDGPSVRTAAIVPTGSGTMYFVGTSTGVYSTFTLAGGGTTWALEGGDILGNVVVDMLVARPDDGTIVAATHGRGVYQATIGQGGASAVASLDVNELAIDVAPGSDGSATFTLTNTGAADLIFSAGGLGKTDAGASGYRLQPDPTLRRPSGDAHSSAPRADGLEPKRIAASVRNDSRSALSEGDFIVLDDGSDLPDDFLGWGDGESPFQWGSRFYAPVGGFTLESVYVYMRSGDETSFPVSVFISDTDGTMYLTGSLTLTPSTDGTSGEWYHVYFDPISLPEGQPFDIELVAHGEIFYPAAVDANGLVPESGFLWVNSGWYSELSSIDGYEDGAWLIRAEGTAGGTSLNQPPRATIAASTSQPSVNETVVFDGSASKDPDGSITQFSWSFGDGAASSVPTPQHAYGQPGLYTVTLTVRDNEGATGQVSKQITVLSDNQPPVALIQASRIQAEVNESITFDGSGSSDPDGTIAGYAWTFGDGASSAQSAPTHAYTQAGSHVVSLTVTDNEGASGRSTLQIDILAEPSRLSVFPLNGRLAPGESQVITVTYYAPTGTDGQYSGQVKLTTNGGNITIPVTVRVDASVDVEPDVETPRQFSLAQNYPNPFNPQTTLEFTLERPSSVRLIVFDLHGRVIRVLIDGTRTAGVHQVAWDGEDGAGRPVASGTYLYRLETSVGNGEVASHLTRKMILLR